jgi:hypothetical protein
MSTTTPWHEEELRRIAGPDELLIAPIRRNGELRRATVVWAVRTGDGLSVRAAHEPNKGWHGVACTSRRAHIEAAGIQHRATPLRLTPREDG